MRKQGFTLIELMIVIAIIAIIAAIAIPNLLSGRISANENSAAAALKLFTSSEAIWLQQDPDGNGRKDYWTYDVSCLHRMFRADSTTKVAFIAIDLAKADNAAAVYAGVALPFGAPTIEAWTWAGVTTTAKSGYLFQAMALDNSTGGVTYKVNPVGTLLVNAANNSKYGFMAAPEAYATSGNSSFIVNEAGTVFANDTGGNANKWMTIAAGGLNWPTSNPSAQDGPGGRKWRVAD
ncbi:MAG: DUF2950 family protein [Planctomycetota bacterium]